MVAVLTLSAAALPDAAYDMPFTAHASAGYADAQTESYAMQVAAIVNRERAANGLAPLQYSDRLSEAALIRAGEIQSVFSHTRPDGSRCFTALAEAGISYRSAGENIAYGQRTPEEVMQSWMNSSGHRANILGTYDYIGVGVTYKNGTYYWSQFFAVSDDLNGKVISYETPSTTTASTVRTTARATSATSAPTTQSTTATTQSTTATTQSTTATTQSTTAATQPTTRATEGGACADGGKCRCSRRARLKQTLLTLLKKQSEQ